MLSASHSAIKYHNDTIVAIATPPGKGGVGIVRISGPEVQQILRNLVGQIPSPRHAALASFLEADGVIIDTGLVLFFPNPHSFTGEDVVELHGHGGLVVMDNLLKRVIELGARQARAGEFSERAFLNNKIDLTQAEAIADLIDAQSQQAARSAMQSLQGEFSKKIHHLVYEVIQLRTYVEAAIDFPDEEIDFLSDGKVAEWLATLLKELRTILTQATQGRILREGMSVVIAGQPNAGKSSLLNALSGQESAIVTAIPGTTRDVIREHINLDGLPLHIIDTAGLRATADGIEQEGIRRAWKEIEKAEVVLMIIDSSESLMNQNKAIEELQAVVSNKPFLIIKNKIDLNHFTPKIENNIIYLSAKTEEGVELLREELKKIAGYNPSSENQFIARRRHLEALKKAEQFLSIGQKQLHESAAGELLAEDLRQAQQALSEITGQFTSDDLLGSIFSSFCIGK